MQITKEDGTVIDVLTLEEAESAKQVAIEEQKKAAEETLQAKLEELKAKEEELVKLKDKDFNFANLRESNEKLKKELDEKLNAAKKEIFENVLKDQYAEGLQNLVGTDAELKKKVEFQYNRLHDAAGTKEEIAKKLRDAYLLATTEAMPETLNSSVISSGGVGRIKPQSKQTFSQEEKDFLQKMAQAGGIKITEDDLKKAK